MSWPGRVPGHDRFRRCENAAELRREPSRYPSIFGRARFARVRPVHEHGGSAMNWDQIEGNWVKAKGKLRQQWGKLTDDDVDVINGKREELAGRLQERYGYQKEQAEKAIDEWMKKAS
jgi:uncharacterized protein YjbJ (UPF0337 family)